VARCVLNIAIPEVRLDRAQVVAIVGELVAAGMAQHVGVDLDAQIGRGDRPPDRAGEPNAESGAPRSDRPPIRRSGDRSRLPVAARGGRRYRLHHRRSTETEAAPPPGPEPPRSAACSRARNRVTRVFSLIGTSKLFSGWDRRADH
jgi:hypothetical protein